MSFDPHNLPYQPRRQRSLRPDRPLPPPPPEEVDDTHHARAAPPPLPLKDAPAPVPLPPRSSSIRSPPSSEAKTSAAHRLPFVTSLPSSAPSVTDLTPLRAHYLKKTLVNLQVSYELNLLTHPVLGAGALGLIGEPFVLPASLKKDAQALTTGVVGRGEDLPFIRYMFHQFLLPFPFLAAAPPSFWSAKVQPFLSSFLSMTGVSSQTTLSREEQEMADSLMTKEERKEAAERKKMWGKVEKNLALMFGAGIKLVGGEEVVRIDQTELSRLEKISEDRRRKLEERKAEGDAVGFEVNVVGVRLVVEKGRVRNKSHEEFLIRTRRNGVSDVFVSRRYGDFKRLADELRNAFPDYPLPPPPPKDKSVVAAAPVATYHYGTYNPLRAIYGSGTPPPPPSTASSPESPTGPTTTPLSRERNRLTLRAYLQAILALPSVIDSPVLRSFLLSAPTTLTPPEALDTQRRLEADAVREEGRRRFRLEAERRVEGLREGLAQFKGEVLGSNGGLKRVFDVVRRVERVQDLPKAESSVLEWGRISLAATIFQIFVASDTASETLQSLKRLHGLMPYFVLKGILKISNPMAMIRGVLDLFLARPFGGQSLIQRMFSSSLTEDVRLLAEDIEAVQEKVDDPVLCQKIEQYANAPYEIQETYRRDALNEGVELLVVILRSPEMPSLSRPQFQRVFKASRAYKDYKAAQADLDDSDDDLGPDNDDAWLFEDLNILMKLWTRKKEKEQLLALIFEGVTAELLKDIITIFYTPLAQVYKAASIADSLSDLQNFLNDMIKTVEQVEELSQEDPQRTVQTFIDLVQRHEQAFYSFVHNVHSKGQGLFDSLMSWIELFLNYARDGLPQPIDLEFLLPHAGPEREQIMQEVDTIAMYHYRLKIAHEEKIRRRFQSSDGQTDEEAALLDSVMASLSISENTVADAGEIEDEDDESGDEDGSEDEEGGSAVDLRLKDLNESELEARRGSGGGSPTGRSSIEKFRSSLDFKRKHKEGTTSPARNVVPREKLSKKARAKKARHAQAELNATPETKAIGELRPLFVEIIRPSLVVRRLEA
ncbi:hypothetical protein P7C73_g1666, partial [Tremellales sp. Uapishka_1]